MKIGISFETIKQLIKAYAYFVDNLNKKHNELFFKLKKIFGSPFYASFPFKWLPGIILNKPIIVPNYLGMYKGIIKKINKSEITKKEFELIDKSWRRSELNTNLLNSAEIVWKIILKQSRLSLDTEQILIKI